MSGKIKIGGTTLRYEINADESTDKRFVVITDVAEDAEGDLAIPAEIEGCPVTSIGEHAFYDCSGLTIMTIPNSVTSIGKGTFWGCSGLTNASLPKHLKEALPWDAFEDCSPELEIAYRDA